MSAVSSRRRATLGFGLGALALVGALGLVTATVVRQQRAHAVAVAEALYHEDLRTAMWRMETLVGTLLATATNRTPEGRKSADFSNNWISTVENETNPLDAPSDDLRNRVVQAADEAFLMCKMIPFEPEAVPELPPTNQQVVRNRGAERSAAEYQQRVGTNSNLQLTTANGVGTEVVVGPLAPVWDDSEGALRLHLARRVDSPLGASHESYRLDWDELRATLLERVADLFPEAELEPLVDPTEVTFRLAGVSDDKSTEDDATRLAAIPARLVVPPPKPAEGLPRGHVWTLGGAWITLLLALGAGAQALRSGFEYGDKHRRFTQTVTHELRTPLTTFRMYSEMLNRGMVDEASRKEYLETLESESTRLAALVENVLRYARLEEGSGAPTRRRVGAEDLVDRCLPELARSAAAAGARLEIRTELEGSLALDTDPEAVLQVLSNLVDNACKYGARESDDDVDPRMGPSVVLRASVDESSGTRMLCLDVADDGPGVPADVARRVFDPFDRGHRDAADQTPGVGLGLALARGLSVELGGSLTLMSTVRGATFRLALPLV